jgi:hypothetical protein
MALLEWNVAVILRRWLPHFELSLVFVLVQIDPDVVSVS